MLTIPGMSYFIGLPIKSGTGEIDRFPNADHLVSYAGLILTVLTHTFTCWPVQLAVVMSQRKNI